MNLRKRWRVFSALFMVSILCFTSCENFLQGTDVKEEITKSIEYNNAPSYAINVEALAGTGTIKTPATGEVTKKVTDTFTIRFEPAENHKFIKWEAVVKGMSTGEKAADYITFEDSESLETKVTFKKASSKTIVLRPVCPEYIGVKEFNMSAADKVYPKDSTVILTFNKPIAEDCINNISLIIPGLEEGEDYKKYFKAPQLKNDNQVIFYADWNKETGPNYIPVALNENKPIGVNIPKDKVYYVCKDYLDPVKIYLNTDINFTYNISSETSKQVNLKFLVDENTNGTLRVNDELPADISDKQSIGKTLSLRYKPSEGYYFDKWAVTRKYQNENGENKTDTIYIDENKTFADALAAIHLSVSFLENEETAGYDSLSNVAQAVIAVDNYIDGNITITPLNKPRNKIQFKQFNDELGTFKINDVLCDNQLHEYSVGKAVSIKFKVNDGYKFRGWKIVKSVLDAQGQEKLEELASEVYETYLECSYPDDTEDGYNEVSRTASLTILNKQYYSDKFVIYADVTTIPYASIYFDGTNGKSSLSTGTHSIKEGTETQVTYTPDSDYEFIRWQIMDKTSGEELQNGDYIYFPSITDEITSFTIVKAPDEDSDVSLLVKPYLAERPSVLSYTPLYSASGVKKDTTIKVMFDYDMNEDSFYYTNEELKKLRTELNIAENSDVSSTEGSTDKLLKKTDINRYYGYQKDGKVFFKNVIIKNSNTDANLLQYFNGPTFDNARTVSITVNKENPVPNYTALFVSIEKDAFYKKEGKIISMSGAKKWIYQVNNTTDRAPPMVLDTYNSESFPYSLKDLNGHELTVATSAPGQNNISTLYYVPEVEVEGELKRDLKLHIVLKDDSEISNTFTASFTRIFDEYYNPIAEDEQKPVNMLIKYSGMMGQDAVFDDAISLDTLPEGVYKLRLLFDDQSNNKLSWPRDGYAIDSTTGSITLGNDADYYLAIDKTKPALPAPEITNEEDNTLKVIWNKNGVKDFKEAVIKYKKHADTDYVTLVPYANNITQQIYTSLLGGTNYDFSITFKDYAGNEIEYKPVAYVRPDKPSAVTVVAKNNNANTYGDTAVKINATIPATGHYTGVRIRYYPVGTADANWSSVTIPTESSEINTEITNLLKGTKYEFDVATYDADNDKYSVVYTAASGKPKFATIPAAPSYNGLPAHVSSTSEIPYAYITPNSPFTKLWLYYRKTSDNWSDSNRVELTTTTQGTSVKYTKTGLEAGTRYYFKLRTYFDNENNYVESSSDWCYTQPNAVASFTIGDYTNNSITVNWTAPSSGNYTGFVLYYKTASSTSYSSVPINSSTTRSYKLTGLSPATSYNLYITSKASNESAKSTICTEQTSPNPVSGFNALNGNSTGGKKKITLSWTNPATYNSIKIYSTNDETKIDDVSKCDVTAITKGTTSFVFDQLDTGKTFYYKVRTFTDTDHFTDSNVVSCSTSINAPVITGVIPVDGYTDRLKVTWTNPDELDGIRIYKGTISDANLYKTITQTSTSYSENCAASKTASCIVTGFNANEYHRIYVVAYKTLNGKEFTASAYDSAYTYAASVTSLTATANSSTEITLNWTNPTDTSYWSSLYIYNVTTGSYVNSSITDKTTTSYKVTGLTPGKSYTFRVRTNNASGNTNTSYPTATMATLAAAPQNLKVESVSTKADATTASYASSAKLTWDAPAGYAKNYTVYYKLRSNSSWITLIANTTSTSYTITDYLDAGQLYDFKVVSYYNNSTPGEFSTTATYTPPTAARNLSYSSRTSTSINYTWTAPKGNCTYQVLYYRKKGTSYYSSSSYLSASTTSYNLTGLSSGTQYEVYVWCYYGSTSASISSSTYSAYTTTATPTNVAVRACDGGTRVSWTAPSGNVSGYYVYYCKNGETNWSYYTTTNTYYQFGNSTLTNNYKYFFYVKAYSDAGTSSSSGSVSFFTPPPGLSDASIYQDDGMGYIVIKFYNPSSSYSADVFVNGVYKTYSSFGSGYQYYTYNIPNYKRGTSYSIRLAPYHGNNSPSGDTADWAQEYPNETYGTSVVVTTNSVGNLVVNGNQISYSNLNNVITSYTYINNTTGQSDSGTYAGYLYDGAFPKSRYVYLSPYSIGAFEVTQQFFEKVMGSNPSTDKYNYYPVNNVSWYHAIAFCNKLSALHGLTPYYTISGYSSSDWKSITFSDVPTSDSSDWNKATYNTSANGYRLPTECEHEFAARGGSTSYYAWTYNYPGSDTLADVAWVKSNSGGYLHSVGQKPGNRLNLYDMSGNIKEWLNDWNNDPGSGTYYNPYCDYNCTSGGTTRLKKKESKVLLKGGYYGSNDNAWVDSNGDKWESYKRDYSTGFRICRPKTY